MINLSKILLLFLLFINVRTFSTKTYYLYFKETITILHYQQHKNNKKLLFSTIYTISTIFETQFFVWQNLLTNSNYFRKNYTIFLLLYSSVISYHLSDSSLSI